MRDYAAIQRTWELQSLLGDVARLRPRVVVEIGTHRGGTLFCWAKVSDPAAHLISIDLPDPAQGMGTTDADIARLRPLLRPEQRLTCLRGDSHEPSTLTSLVGALGGGPVDLLWIDGDHSDAGVRMDVKMYAPLVRAGGIVAMHDIQESREFPANQVHHAWAELKQRFRAREYIDQPAGGGMGIGVIDVPAGTGFWELT